MAWANECLERAVATDAPKNVVKARRLRTQVFLARDELSVRELDYHLASARALLDEDAFAAAWAEGRAIPLGQAIVYALSGASPPG
jgi:hypothetical protein